MLGGNSRPLCTILEVHLYKKKHLGPGNVLLTEMPLRALKNMHGVVPYLSQRYLSEEAY